MFRVRWNHIGADGSAHGTVQGFSLTFGDVKSNISPKSLSNEGRNAGLNRAVLHLADQLAADHQTMTTWKHKRTSGLKPTTQLESPLGLAVGHLVRE